MNPFILSWIRVCALFLCFVSASAVWGEDPTPRLSSLTHLNGSSRQIVQASTFCLQNNNTRGPFFYDRRERSPFVVPKGFSFVITDIIITPCIVDPNLTDRFLVVVDIGDGSRNFVAGYIGAITQHYHLTGGIVVPEETTVAGRNTTASSSLVDVVLLGYFVKGPGLDEGQPFPFHDDKESDHQAPAQ